MMMLYSNPAHMMNWWHWKCLHAVTELECRVGPEISRLISQNCRNILQTSSNSLLHLTTTPSLNDSTVLLTDLISFLLLKMFQQLVTTSSYLNDKTPESWVGWSHPWSNINPHHTLHFGADLVNTAVSSGSLLELPMETSVPPVVWNNTDTPISIWTSPSDFKKTIVSCRWLISQQKTHLYCI